MIMKYLFFSLFTLLSTLVVISSCDEEDPVTEELEEEEGQEVTLHDIYQERIPRYLQS